MREAYGTRAMVLYNVAVLIFFASGSTFNVAGFIWPPWGQELVMSAALVIINGAALITLSGIAIPRSSEGARVKRLSMILTLLGSWLEVSTDCASGVSALRNNQKVFGIIILTSGVLAPLLQAHVITVFTVLCTRSLSGCLHINQTPPVECSVQPGIV